MYKKDWISSPITNKNWSEHYQPINLPMIVNATYRKFIKKKLDMKKSHKMYNKDLNDFFDKFYRINYSARSSFCAGVVSGKFKKQSENKQPGQFEIQDCLLLLDVIFYFVFLLY